MNNIILNEHLLFTTYYYTESLIITNAPKLPNYPTVHLATIFLGLRVLKWPIMSCNRSSMHTLLISYNNTLIIASYLPSATVPSQEATVSVVIAGCCTIRDPVPGNHAVADPAEMNAPIFTKIIIPSIIPSH